VSFKLNILENTQNTQIKYNSEKANNTKHSKKTTLVQSPFTTLGQETRWAYSTTLPSPHLCKNIKRVNGTLSMSRQQTVKVLNTNIIHKYHEVTFESNVFQISKLCYLPNTKNLNRLAIENITNDNTQITS